MHGKISSVCHKTPDYRATQLTRQLKRSRANKTAPVFVPALRLNFVFPSAHPFLAL